jgi:hypothetical protein
MIQPISYQEQVALIAELTSENKERVSKALETLCQNLYAGKVHSLERRLRDIGEYAEMNSKNAPKTEEARMIVMRFVFLVCKNSFIAALTKLPSPQNLVSYFATHIDLQINNKLKEPKAQKRDFMKQTVSMEAENENNFTQYANIKAEAEADFKNDFKNFVIHLHQKKMLSTNEMLQIFLNNDIECAPTYAQEQPMFNQNLFNKAISKLKKEK